MKRKSGGQARFDRDAAVVAMRFERLFAWVGDASGVSERRYRRETLERAFMQADPGVISEVQRTAAAALSVEPGVLEGALGEAIPDHAVHVPLVLLPSGEGFVRLMHVAHDVSVHGGYELDLDARARRAASEALSRAALRLEPSEDVSRCRFTTTHPEALRTEHTSLRLTGPSLGAGAYVSACSLWSRRPVRSGTVVTGRIVGNAVRDVGKIAEKIEGIVLGRHDLRRLILPRGLGAKARRTLARHGVKLEVVEVDDLDGLLDAALEPTPRADGDIRHRVAGLRRAFESGWRGFRWLTLREHAERVAAQVPDTRPDLTVEVLSMLGAVQEHLGAPLAGLAILERAARIAESDDGGAWVPDQARAHLYQHLSMACRGLGRVKQGRAAARHAIAAATRGRQRDELYKALGCAGLLELSAGRPGHAAAHFERSLELVHAHAPGSCARTHGYLVDALGAAGHIDAALAEYALGLEHLHAQRAGSRRDFNEAWLRTSLARALSQAARPAAVVELLEVPCTRQQLASAPLPGLWIRRLLGVALTEVGRAAQGYELLAASTTVHGANMEPGLHFVAQVNVMCEAVQRLRHGAYDQDIAGRLSSELSRLPPYLLREPGLQRLRVRAERALRRVDSGASRERAAAVDALERLLVPCERLA